MLQERLLERIRRTEDDPDHRGVVDPNDVSNSIMRHLQKILNTSQGSVPIDDDYGVPDFTDLAANFSSESVRELSRTIKKVITKYEPRLSSINIEAEPHGQNVIELRFKIEGKMAVDENNNISVSFETIVDPDGRVTVSH